MAATIPIVRNLRLLTGSMVQHLRDDPVLLAVQISRRLPMRTRVRTGSSLRTLGATMRTKGGISALGAVMSGDSAQAVEILEQRAGRASRLLDEVAVLVDRVDLLSGGAAASTRSRARWSQGDLSGAMRILDEAGAGSSAHAERLRSEVDLLEEGFALPVPPSVRGAGARRPEARLRVLHLLTNSLPHTQSGYAVRTHNILTALREHGTASLALTRTGYPVMIGRPFCADEDVVDGIRYRRTLPSELAATPQGRLEQEVDEAMRLVAEFRPHVLHATTDFHNALVAEAVSTATGIPWVLEVRGLLEKTWIASHGSAESRAQAARSEKVRRVVRAESDLARRADAVVTLSRTMAEDLIGRGVPEEKITLVPNGVDRSLLEADLSTAKARAQLDYRIPGDALAVGAISALVDYEGFDILLRAVASILSNEEVPQKIRDRLHVVLVGDGVSAPGLHDLAEELGLLERVTMPGRVPREQARVWVQALDVVVVPRRDLEVSRTVTPQKPVEAMALSRPVVVSDLPALRETIEDDDGRTVGAPAPPDSPRGLADVLVALLDDPSRRKALGRDGRAAAGRRTWPVLMERYEAVYEDAVRASHG